MGNIEVERYWVPGESPDDAANDLLRLSGYLEDVRIPLMEAQGILENDIRNAFDTETDPGGIEWAPLNDVWAEAKQEDQRFLPVGDSPSGDYILRLTGDLYETATDPGNFRIVGDSVVFDPSGLPEYGVYHQTGTGKMPARPFIGVSENAEEEIYLAVSDWINIGIEEIISGPIFDPGVSRYRIPKGQPGAGRFARKT